jgi:hypothetical protein
MIDMMVMKGDNCSDADFLLKFGMLEEKLDQMKMHIGEIAL